MKELKTAIQLLKQARKDKREIIAERVGQWLLLSDTAFIIRVPVEALDPGDHHDIVELFGQTIEGTAKRIKAGQLVSVDAFLQSYLDKYIKATNAQAIEHKVNDKAGRFVDTLTGQQCIKYDIEDHPGANYFISIKYKALLTERVAIEYPKESEANLDGWRLALHRETLHKQSITRPAVILDDTRGYSVVVLPIRFYKEVTEILEEVSNYQANQAAIEFGPILFTIKTNEFGKRSTLRTWTPWNYAINKGTIYAPESAIKDGGDPDKLIRVETITAGVPSGSKRYAELIKRQVIEGVKAAKQAEQDKAQARRFEKVRDEIKARGFDSERVGVYSL
jgi:hypothetical protein